MKAVILAAGISGRLGYNFPKCLLEIGGKALLGRYLESLEKVDILDVTMVVGYKKEMIVDYVERSDFPGSIKVISNSAFTAGSILSLYEARKELNGGVLLMDSDVYFEEELLRTFIREGGENAVALDISSCGAGEEMMVEVEDGRVLDWGRNLTGVGEAVGFYKFNDQTCWVLKKLLEEYVDQEGLGYEDIFPELFKKVFFVPVDVSGLRWVEIDFEEDVKRAERLDRNE